MPRLSPEVEAELRAHLATDPPPAASSLVDAGELDGLLGEIDYLREQVEKETAYASEIRRRYEAPPITAENYVPYGESAVEATAVDDDWETLPGERLPDTPGGV